MPTDNVKTLWGHEFRIVSAGLAESDVVAFVNRLMSQNKDNSEDDNCVASLSELGKRTLEKAEALAKEIKEQAEKEGEHRSAEIVSEAEHVADEITALATTAAVANEAESRKKAREKLADLDANLLDMKKWATEEFQALKEREERMQTFLSSFETILRLLEGETDWQEPEAMDNPKALASGDQAKQLHAREDIDKGKIGE
ncbi:MAG: hypothetical protein V3U79_09800 [Dehalococcoidia bacterium]